MQNSKSFKLKSVTSACLLVLGTSALSAYAAEQDDKKKVEDDVEIITVTGIKGSLKKSLNDKRFASEIQDSISAEDIGQLPDENIAEALQRVTGIQMARAENGQGTSVQIRGLSDNNVEINGETVSGTSSDRSINFQDIPSELFSAVTIQKAPTADSIEGSLGGTINLRTRRPLNNSEDFVGNVTAKARYGENSEQTDPDFTGFILKNWRDTSIGDFGLIVNATTREITTLSETYGGGNFDTAPSIWLQRDGGSPTDANNGVSPRGGDNANAGNFFHGQNGSALYTYDEAVDVNNDGVSDDSDVYFMPGGFGFNRSVREEKRDSINTTLHWQPNDSVNFYFDTTLTQGDEKLTGANYSINTNAVRAGVLASGNNVFERLDTTADGTDIYLMTAGRIGAATYRFGAVPNLNHIERDSQRFSISGDWQATDSLLLSFEASTSEGSRETVSQGALNVGIDANLNGAITGSDFAQFFDFSLNGNRIPNVELFAPFTSTTGRMVTEETAEADLVPLPVGSASYDRLSYNSINRVALDTENNADAIRFDGEYELDGEVITTVKFGVRWAERTFSRRSYEGQSQGGGSGRTAPVQSDSGDVFKVNIRQVRVDPANNPTPELQNTAEFLQSCLSSTGGDFLTGESTNLPRTWTASTGCSPQQIDAFFGFSDIRTPRADNPNAGIYERLAERYDVEEVTEAAYIRADYITEVFDMPLTGNFGVRYAKTKTDSRGVANGTFEDVMFENEYDDVLPSLNANLALNEEMILRFGFSKTVGRPGLTRISPAIQLIREETPTIEDGVEVVGRGVNGGNPFLKPIRADNFDLSYEWYYGEESLFSLAYFNKDIDTRIVTGDEGLRLIDGEYWKVESYINDVGTKIDGIEVAVQHAFTSLPGLLAHTGLGANYTYTNEDTEFTDGFGDVVPREALSENSYNVTAFYDDGKFSVRLAYNWRDEFVRTNRSLVNFGFNRPDRLQEVEAARGQLDLTGNYEVSENLRVNFSVINLNGSETRRYIKYEELLNYLSQPGRRYNLGIAYRF